MSHEGLGLGLTIVQNIVRQNEGSLGVESEGINCGSLFCFSMKLYPEEVRSSLPVLIETNNQEKHQSLLRAQSKESNELNISEDDMREKL